MKWSRDLIAPWQTERFQPQRYHIFCLTVMLSWETLILLWQTKYLPQVFRTRAFLDMNPIRCTDSAVIMQSCQATVAREWFEPRTPCLWGKYSTTELDSYKRLGECLNFTLLSHGSYYRPRVIECLIFNWDSFGITSMTSEEGETSRVQHLSFLYIV